ncbi:hypothetical protein JOC26_001333 [Sporohalobacter salinus]|nr:hypothetical protein [Sporohalobacter salinus]
MSVEILNGFVGKRLKRVRIQSFYRRRIRIKI